MLQPRRSRLACLWLAAALALLGGAPGAMAVAQQRVQEPSRDPEILLDRARSALDTGDPAAAERLYRDALGACRCPMAHLGLAESLLALGKPREAAAEAARGAALYLDAGDAEQALAVLEAAAGTDPSSTLVARLRGRALLGLQRYGAAADALAEALRLGDDDLETYLLRAAALWEMGETVDSEAVYREAVHISGGAPVALHQLGSLLLWQGRYAEARVVLDEALAAAPHVPDLALDLGRAAEGTGDLEEAAEAYARAVGFAPDNSGARYALGRLLVRLGRGEEGREHLEAYRRLYEAEQRHLHESKLSSARLDAAWELFSQGRAAEALAELKRAPRTADVLAAMAGIHGALGDLAEAVAVLERALALAPERRDLQLELARARLALEEQR